MKQIIIGLIVMVGFANAEVVKFHWIAPNGQMFETITGNPDHIAIMEKMLVSDCEEEEPVDTGLKLTKEKKDSLSAEDLLLIKPYKTMNKKWSFTDPDTGEKTSGGDDNEYTHLKKFPNFKQSIVEVE